METLSFEFVPRDAAVTRPAKTWALTGVLASGNLEILVEPDGATEVSPGRCRVEVQTSALGFGDVWQAVLEDFFARHGSALAGLRFTIHDAGATPAVVSLRLDQALREFGSPPSP